MDLKDFAEKVYLSRKLRKRKERAGGSTLSRLVTKSLFCTNSNFARNVDLFPIPFSPAKLAFSEFIRFEYFSHDSSLQMRNNSGVQKRPPPP
jgi:hypothetical protein